MTNEQKLREAFHMALRALDELSVPSAYEGERTGGVLEGCPRGPAPTPEQLASKILIFNNHVRSIAGMPKFGAFSHQPQTQTKA